MGRSTTNWVPLSLPPDVVARVSSCIKGANGVNEIFRLLKGSGIAPTCCNDLDKIIKRYAGGPQGRSAYYYYQCACGSDEPFKLRIATKRGGKVDVAYQGRHRSEVPRLSVEENGHVDAATMAAVAPAAVAGITTVRGDPAQQHPKRQRLEEKEKKQGVECQGSGSDQEPTATTEAGVVAPDVHRVEPTRIPYRPDNEGIVRGKLHPLVASKNCEYYTKPFTVKKGALERDVWRGQDDEDGGSDDCCMTFRGIREGVAEAFREAQALGDELVNHYPHVDCTRIGGNRVEYFLSDEKCCAFNTVLVYHGGDFLAKIKKPLWWIRNQILLNVDQFVLEWDENAKALMERRGKGKYVGKVFSIIVSNGHVPAQEYHLDQAYPHYFASLSFTTKGKGTTVVPVQNELQIPLGQLTPEKGLELMFGMVTPRSEGLFGRFMAAISEYDDQTATTLGELEIPLQQMLAEYGWLMTQNQTRNKCLIPSVESDDLGYTGLPGSVIHCGPEFDGFRATLFSDYCLPDEEAYNDDFQLNAGKFVLSFFKMRQFLAKDKEAREFLEDLYRVVVVQEPAVLPSCDRVMKAMKKDDKSWKGFSYFTYAESCNLSINRLNKKRK